MDELSQELKLVDDKVEKYRGTFEKFVALLIAIVSKRSICLEQRTKLNV